MISKTLKKALRPYLLPLAHRYQGFRQSLTFEPKELGPQQFVRYFYYRELARWVAEGVVPNTKETKAIEFGGSNSVIAGILNQADYTVAANWPEVDIQDLKQYGNEMFDVVVLDQVLEHVADPRKAVSEIWRILKKNAVCICATPFLIQIHGSWGDYWRFTEMGLKQLFSQYSSTQVFGWGNRLTLRTTMYSGWLDCAQTKRRFRVAARNEPEWPLVYLTRALK